MSPTDAELRRAVTVLDQYRAQLETLQRQHEVLSLSLEELMRAKETIARYRKAGKGAEVLVPVGANAFLYGKVADGENALIGIGSDLVLEEPVPKALERLDGRIRSLQEATGSLAQRVSELDARVAAQEEFVQGAYTRLEEKRSGTRPEAPGG